MYASANKTSAHTIVSVGGTDDTWPGGSNTNAACSGSTRTMTARPHRGDPTRPPGVAGGPIGFVALADRWARRDTAWVINSTSGSSAPAGYRFPREVIAVAVRWYLRYGLSYRDVEEMLAERGIEVDHVTIYRWV